MCVKYLPTFKFCAMKTSEICQVNVWEVVHEDILIHHLLIYCIFYPDVQYVDPYIRIICIGWLAFAACGPTWKEANTADWSMHCYHEIKDGLYYPKLRRPYSPLWLTRQKWQHCLQAAIGGDFSFFHFLQAFWRDRKIASSKWFLYPYCY